MKQHRDLTTTVDAQDSKAIVRRESTTEIAGKRDKNRVESQVAQEAKLARTLLPHSVVQELSRKIWWRNPLQIFMEYTIIVLAATAAYTSEHWLVYLASLIVIGSRQFSLGLLMHEASHYTLFKKRKSNDLMGEFFSWHIFDSVEIFRETHHLHHVFFTTEKDPSTQDTTRPIFPKSRADLGKDFIKCISGLGIFYLIAKHFIHFWSVRNTMKVRDWWHLSFCMAVVTVFVIWPVTLKLFFLFWLVPGASWSALVAYLRAAGEHEAMPKTNVWDQTRTVDTNLIGKAFLWPVNSQHHFVHHLYPSVPWYNLAKADRLLMENPVFRANVHRTQGLKGLLREITGEVQSRSVVQAKSA